MTRSLVTFFSIFSLVSASTSSAPYRMRSNVIIACQGKPMGLTHGFTVENGPLEKEIPYFWKITPLFRLDFWGVSSPKLKLTTHVPRNPCYLLDSLDHIFQPIQSPQRGLFGYTVRVRDGRNPANSPVEVDRLSNFLQGFICLIHPRWCRISSFKSITGSFHSSSLDFFRKNICVWQVTWERAPIALRLWHIFSYWMLHNPLKSSFSLQNRTFEAKKDHMIWFPATF